MSNSLTILCLALGFVESPPREFDREVARIRNEWKWLDEALDTLRMDSTEVVRDSSNGDVRTENYQLWRSAGGKSALTVDFTREGTRRRVTDFREDGRFTYTFRYFREYPDALDMVDVQSQKATTTRYANTMFRAQWVMTPFGMSYHKLQERQGKFSTTDGKPPRLRFVAQVDKTEFDAILSDKDGLPEELRVTSPEGKMRIEVSSYRYVSDRWFPAAGKGEEEYAGETEASKRTFTFSVSNASVNLDIPNSRFSLPTLPAGVYVRDQTGVKRSRIIGGRQARIDWINRHPSSADRVKIETPLNVNDESDSNLPAWILGSVSIGCGVIASVIRYRQGA